MQPVISDAHTGLKAAISSVFLGAAWQRCRVPFMRNVLAAVPKGNQEMLAAAIRTIFAQPDAEHVTEQFEVIAGMFGKQLPKVEEMLRERPRGPARVSPCSRPRTGRRSGRPLPRTTQQGSQTPHRRGRGLPNPAALLRLAGAVLVETHDEWQVAAERRYLSERSMALLTTKTNKEVAKPELMTA